jgi:hypothetical protein
MVTVWNVEVLFELTWSCSGRNFTGVPALTVLLRVQCLVSWYLRNLRCIIFVLLYRMKEVIILVPQHEKLLADSYVPAGPVPKPVRSKCYVLCSSVLDHVYHYGRCIGNSVVSISLLLIWGTVNSTGNGKDWVIDAEHIQIACTLLAVKGYLFSYEFIIVNILPVLWIWSLSLHSSF